MHRRLSRRLQLKAEAPAPKPLPSPNTLDLVLSVNLTQRSPTSCVALWRMQPEAARAGTPYRRKDAPNEAFRQHRRRRLCRAGRRRVLANADRARRQFRQCGLDRRRPDADRCPAGSAIMVWRRRPGDRGPCGRVAAISPRQCRGGRWAVGASSDAGSDVRRSLLGARRGGAVPAHPAACPGLSDDRDRRHVRRFRRAQRSAPAHLARFRAPRLHADGRPLSCRRHPYRQRARGDDRGFRRRDDLCWNDISTGSLSKRCACASN